MFTILAAGMLRLVESERLPASIDLFRNVVLVNFIVERLATVLIYPQ
jgi:hypothetical protein